MEKTINLHKKYLLLLMFLSAFCTAGVLSTRTTIAGEPVMPHGFTDQAFYDCVAKEYRIEYPDDDISMVSGMTDTQLARVKRLDCSAEEGIIRDLNGFSRMISLRSVILKNHEITSISFENKSELQTLDLSGNPITELDVSSLPNLQYLYADGIILKTDLVPVVEGRRIYYDLSGIPYLWNGSQTIEETNFYFLDSFTRNLVVTNYYLTEGHAVTNFGMIIELPAPDVIPEPEPEPEPDPTPDPDEDEKSDAGDDSDATIKVPDTGAIQ